MAVTGVQKPWLKVKPEQGKWVQPGGKAAGKNGKGKGAAKGWAGAGKGAPAVRSTVPASFEVDREARYQGTVGIYKKWSGYGFINLSQEGVVPGDKVFVYWKSIQSEDRFPSLQQGMEVEFGIAKVKDPATGSFQLRAKGVSLPGGDAISLQDEIDAQKKEFVGGQYLRYTGTLKFFSPQKGFGYIQMDDGYQVPADVPKEIRVELSEVNAGAKQPLAMKDLQVEFGIWKTPKGAYKAYNMTLPGGLPVSQEGLEHRKVVTGRTFQGLVEAWNWRQGWGFIKMDASTPVPANVMAKIRQMRTDALAKGKQASGPNDKVVYFRKADIQKGVKIEKEQQVTFQLYTDDKGAGACDIH